jgi:hypothetical protein
VRWGRTHAEDDSCAQHNGARGRDEAEREAGDEAVNDPRDEAVRHELSRLLADVNGVRLAYCALAVVRVLNTDLEDLERELLGRAAPQGAGPS